MATHEIHVGGELRPRGDVKVRKIRRLSPSGTSGVIIGGLGGGALAGPAGALVGMVAGGIAGEALERYFPSRPEGPAKDV
jgi:hypothetical protein